MEGYIKTSSKGIQPVFEWWMAQIEASEKEKNAALYADRWPLWDEWYEADFPAGWYIKNIFFMMERSLVPRLYLQNPKVTLTTKRSDEGYQEYAKLFTGLDNRIIDLSGGKNEFKKATQIAFRYGAGIIQAGFGSSIGGLTLEEAPEKDDFVYDLDQISRNDMPWIKAIHPKDFGLAAGVARIKDSFFSYQFIERSIDDIINDPRLKNTHELWKQYDVHTTDQPQEKISLIEIRDRRYQKVIIYAKDFPSDPIVFENDLMQSKYGLPFDILTFNPSPSSVWGTPDSKVLEPFQNEMNDLKKQISKQAHSIATKILSEKDNFSSTEKEKMVSTDSEAIVEAKKISKVKLFAIGDIPTSLLNAVNTIMDDARETVGFSRNAFGAYEPGSRDITATEAQIVRSSGEIKIDERRDNLFDTMKRLMQHVHIAITNFMTPDDVIDILGEEAKDQFEKFKVSSIDPTFFDVTIHPESSVLETSESQERRALSTYAIFKDNPLINQQEFLTQTLLKVRDLEPEKLVTAPVPQAPAGAEENPLAALLQGAGGGSPLPSPSPQIQAGPPIGGDQ